MQNYILTIYTVIFFKLRCANLFYIIFESTMYSL